MVSKKVYLGRFFKYYRSNFKYCILNPTSHSTKCQLKKSHVQD